VSDRRTRERAFYVALCGAMAALVFIGFARTYFLRTFFGTPPPAPFVMFHGALMSGWIALLLVQAVLISRSQVLWHRRLGIAGVTYAALIVIVGCMTTLRAAAREVAAHSQYVGSQLDVLALELTQMILFGSLVAAAVLMRARTDWHKRLMIMATLCILPNVIVRISFWFPGSPSENSIYLALWIALVLLVVGVDAVRFGGIHRAYRLAAPAAVVALLMAHMVGITAAWVRLGSWLVS